MRVTIRSNARRVEGAIQGIVAKVVNDPITNTPRYEALMRRGTDSHFRKLSFGGIDSTALGGQVSWSRARHPITKGRRGGTSFPLLDTGNSFLRLGFTSRATTRARSAGTRGVLVTQTAMDSRVRALGRVHKDGLAPINAAAQGFKAAFRVPKREFLYWDQQMANEALKNLARAFKEAKAEAAT